MPYKNIEDKRAAGNRYYAKKVKRIRDHGRQLNINALPYSGCYTLELHCDTLNVEHDSREFPHCFTGHSFLDCKTQAVTKGWVIHKGKRTTTCPRCCKKWGVHQHRSARTRMSGINPLGITPEQRIQLASYRSQGMTESQARWLTFTPQQHERARQLYKHPICESCGVNLADYPSKLCPGCQAISSD